MNVQERGPEVLREIVQNRRRCLVQLSSSNVEIIRLFGSTIEVVGIGDPDQILLGLQHEAVSALSLLIDFQADVRMQVIRQHDQLSELVIQADVPGSGCC